MNRREFLAVGGVTAIGGLAGCSSPSGSEEVEGVPKPSVSESALSTGGWTKIDEMSKKMFSTEILGLISVEAYAHTLIFEDARLRKNLKKGTMGNFDATVMSFFATRVELNPDLDKLPVGKQESISRTAEQAKARFTEQLRNQGLTDIKQTGTETFTVESGDEADVTNYSGRYSFPSMSVPLPSGESVEIEGGSIDVSGMVAIWQNDQYIIVSGGGYPAENFSKQFEKQITDMVGVTINVDLGLDPRDYEAEIEDLIKSVT